MSTPPSPFFLLTHPPQSILYPKFIHPFQLLQPPETMNLKPPPPPTIRLPPTIKKGRLLLAW